MKDVILKGHPLTENESKEVKGGAIYVMSGDGVPESFSCNECGHYIYLFEYNADKKLFYAVCDVCGCRNEVKKEE